MTHDTRTPRWPALPASVTVTFGGPGDIAPLRPFWLALHHIHQQADPELAPHVDDDTSWTKRPALYEHCLASPDAFLLLVRRDGELIGYAVVAVEPDGDASGATPGRSGTGSRSWRRSTSYPRSAAAGSARCCWTSSMPN